MVMKPARHPGEGRDPVETRRDFSSRDPGLRRDDGVWQVLEGVMDPEIPVVSVVDLGIVRDVGPDRVTITPTYTGCPASIAIAHDIRAALDRAGLSHINIETTLSPPWTTDWISDQGREKLRAYGIAPPPKGAAKHSLRETLAECPRCGSSHTEEISRFGSTPCKALHRCLDCREPFDRFKCH
jgi:ring-1,2-phenylacetyl-CoA epoxidase subunit PaaD